MSVGNLAPAKGWNENHPKRCLVSHKLSGLLWLPTVASAILLSGPLPHYH